MSIIFKAWIPNVSGRLSFRVIGDTSHPTRCLHSNGTVNGRGQVIASQTRLLDDSLLPSEFLRKLVFSDSVLQFILIGEWTQQVSKYDPSKMTGCIAMIPKNQQETYSNSVSLAIEEWNSVVSKQETENDANTTHVNELKRVMLSADYFCNFTLARDGELTLHIKQLPNLEYQAPEMDYKQREHQLAGEFYFFLRDIAHSHRHHSPHSDKVLDVKRVDNSDDQAWIASVFAALRRHAIGINRSSNSRNVSDHNGFLAYAESFKAICDRRHHSLSKHMPLFTDILFQPMKASVDARNLADETGFEQMNSRAMFIMTALVSFLALVLAALALLQLQPERFKLVEIDSLLVCGGKSVLKNASFYIYLSISFFIVAMLWAAGKLRPFYHWLSDVFYRLIHSKNKQKTVLAALLAAVISVVISYCALRSSSTFDISFQEFLACRIDAQNFPKLLKEKEMEDAEKQKAINKNIFLKVKCLPPSLVSHNETNRNSVVLELKNEKTCESTD